MSGTKKDRVSLKNRFKRGMYPTEDDFADVFESYLHKDDTIPVSKVTVGEGGEPIGNAIDKKADKQTLETFINEMETVLETVRDENTNKITHTVITDLAQRITDAENDIANAANAAETNGDAIAKILTILGKQDGETVSELASRFSALSGDYATVFAFVSKVKTFLESADVADTTINRWQEIESFLQGITDTKTLTGLLADLKQEILAEIPEPQPQPSGNYLELVSDLDDYTDAPEGKIVKYVGQTNEKYTRGFDYEYKASEGYPTPNVIVSAALPGDLQAGNIYVYSGVDTLSVYILSLYNGGRAVVIGEPVVGDKLYANYYNGEIHAFDITNVREDTTFGKLYVTAGGNEFEFKKAQDKIEVGSWTNYSDSEEVIFIISGNDNGNFTSWVYCPRLGRATYVTFSGSMPAQGAMAWQPIPSFNVIN